MPWALAGFAVAVWIVYDFLRYRNFLTAGYDLGIFDQAVQAYARFQVPEVPLKGLHYNLLGDHFHPIVASLAPLYWIWSDPRMLLIAQAVLLGVSAYPVWRFVRRRFGAGVSAAVTAAYLFSWPILGMVNFDFHEVAFGVPIMAFLIDALDRRSYAWVIALSCLLLLVREDMGILVLMVAIVVALRRRWLVAGVLAVIGVGGYLLTTEVLIPAAASSGVFAYWTYDVLGPDLPSALRTIVTHPLDAARAFFTPWVKTITLLWAFGLTTLLLALASPYALITLPIFAERFFSSREALWTTDFHYTGILAPVLFMGGVDTLDRLVRRFDLSPRWPRAFAAVVLAIPVVGSFLFLQIEYPLGALVTGQAWTPSARAESLARIVPMIPPGVCVAADDRAVPQLLHRNYVTNPGIPSPPPSYVILDMSQDATGYLGPTPQEFLAKSLADGYRVVAQDGTIVLLTAYVPVDPLCRTYSS